MKFTTIKEKKKKKKSDYYPIQLDARAHTHTSLCIFSPSFMFVSPVHPNETFRFDPEERRIESNARSMSRSTRARSFPNRLNDDIDDLIRSCGTEPDPPFFAQLCNTTPSPGANRAQLSLSLSLFSRSLSSLPSRVILSPSNSLCALFGGVLNRR